MGHVYADIVVKGSKGEKVLSQVLVDTGATYTVLPRAILDEIGAWGPLATKTAELGNGTSIEAQTFAIVVKIMEIDAPTIAMTFDGALTLIGVEALESAGLKVDPTTGRLEHTRPKGVTCVL